VIEETMVREENHRSFTSRRQIWL